jgi:hypothetical protein
VAVGAFRGESRQIGQGNTPVSVSALQRREHRRCLGRRQFKARARPCVR